MDKRLQRAANRLAGVLSNSDSQKVVFAESCTAGLVSASLATVPGISNHLCGSLVTYRASAKEAFLNVDPVSMATHTTVSQPVTDQMAIHALARMKEATWSAAVTGHLGPGVPDDVDGQVFVSVARRETNDGNATGDPQLVACKPIQLQAEDRSTRQQEAASWVLETLSDIIRSSNEGS